MTDKTNWRRFLREVSAELERLSNLLEKLHTKVHTADGQYDEVSLIMVTTPYNLRDLFCQVAVLSFSNVRGMSTAGICKELSQISEEG